uniref:ATP-grasp domain-containing protein n=1 Tax=Thauera sp. SDU_THAU2 TaxID=3136633 RepID=UPI00311EEE2D
MPRARAARCRRISARPSATCRSAATTWKSWQPMAMSPAAVERSRQIAKAVTDDLGGLGLFGVELFVKGDQQWLQRGQPAPASTPPW